MRQKVLSIAVALPLVVVMGLWTMSAAQRVSEQGQAMVDEIEAAMRAGEPESACAAARALEENWEKWEAALQLWVCHEDTDQVREKLLLVLCGLENDDRGMVMENTALLREALTHLHHRDDVTWSNVF